MIIFTSTKTRAASRRWAALLLMLVGLSAATLGRAATVTDLRANTLPGDGVEVIGAGNLEVNGSPLSTVMVQQTGGR